MNNIQVVGLGALNVDYIYQVERILYNGEALVKNLTLSPGGSAANTIYGLARLGVKAGFIGAIGNDENGILLTQDFRKVSVDTSQIKLKPQAKTGSVVCLSDSLGKRSLYVLPGANNLFSLDDLDIDYINQAEMLHLSSFADYLDFKIDNLVPNLKLSFAPGALYATKGLPTLTPILKRTHILFINQNEIRQLTGQDIKAGAESCLEHGCHIVVVTLGKGTELESSKGDYDRTVTAACYIRDRENEYIIEQSGQAEVPEVDTTGAGDAFATGFLYGLHKGLNLQECGILGDITAHFSTTKIGAREGLPTLDELSQRYRELYNKEI